MQRFAETLSGWIGSLETAPGLRTPEASLRLPPPIGLPEVSTFSTRQSKADHTLAACEALLDRVAVHALAGHAPYRGRLERATMAMRLARWLRTPEEDVAGSFGQLARRYRDEIAFVDWASDSLAGGDEQAEMSDAFARIERAASTRRAAFSWAFASVLADWTQSGSEPGEVLRVEDVAAQVVAKLLDE